MGAHRHDTAGGDGLQHHIVAKTEAVWLQGGDQGAILGARAAPQLPRLGVDRDGVEALGEEEHVVAGDHRRPGEGAAHHPHLAAGVGAHQRHHIVYGVRHKDVGGVGAVGARPVLPAATRPP
jgi:hypothetical protein